MRRARVVVLCGSLADGSEVGVVHRFFSCESFLAIVSIWILQLHTGGLT